MGTAVIGGMGAATVIAIFLIPVTFYVVERLGHKRDSGAHPPTTGGGHGEGAPGTYPKAGKESHHA
jgi:hypothetical protein